MNKEQEQRLLDRVANLEMGNSAFRFKVFVRQWSGPAGGILAVIGGLIAGLHFLVKPDISSLETDVAAIKGDITRIDMDVAKTNEKIDGLLNKALDKAWQATAPAEKPPTKAQQPKTRAAIEYGNLVLEMANDYGIALSRSSEYGRNVSKLAFGYPALQDVAWRGVKLSLQQQTMKNARVVDAEIRPTSLPILDKSATGGVMLPGPIRGDWNPIGRILAPGQGAFVDYIKPLPHIVIGNNKPPEYILVQHADVTLDNFVLRRLIYSESHIRYRGGDLGLEEVFFVNCDIEVAATPLGEAFVRAVLTRPDVSFLSDPKLARVFPHQP